MKATSSRLEQQIEFLLECDRLKSVLRQTTLVHDARRENSAEHSWTLTLMAMTLAEHANEKLDLLRALKMLILHDLVEVYCGDVFVYDVSAREAQAAQEKAAAQKIFGLLPPDQADEFSRLWTEFEEKQSPEARFAAGLDRLAPLLVNSRTEGGSWKRHGIKKHQVVARNRGIEAGSKALWSLAEEIIADAEARGYLKE